MDLETEYIEYASIFSLSILAISASYFWNPNDIFSYVSLLLIPVLFGYTAYISKDGFKKASFLAMITLIFAILNAQMALIAAVIGFGTPLISFFSNGNKIKDYYGAVSIPMLITGLILAAGFYASLTTNPDLGDNTRDFIASNSGEKASIVIEETQIIEMQKEQQETLIENTEKSTVTATQGYVLNETRNELDAEEQQILNSAFEDANQEIPKQLENEIQEQANEMDLAKQLEQAIQNLFQGKNIIYLTPLIAISFYGLHPVIGALTAISAQGFKKIDKVEN